jgi:hypothetical protein
MRVCQSDAGCFRWYAFAAGLVATLACSSSGATTIVGDVSPLELSASDKEALEDVACRNPHRTSLDIAEGRVYEAPDERSVLAHVVCTPHSYFKDKPLRFVTNCEKPFRQWKCGESELQMLLAVAGRDVVLSAGGSELAWAYELLHKLDVAGHISNDPRVPDKRPYCSIRKSVIPEWYYVRCLGRVVTVSTWCPQGDCPSVVSARDAAEWEIMGD